MKKDNFDKKEFLDQHLNEFMHPLITQIVFHFKSLNTSLVILFLEAGA